MIDIDVQNLNLSSLSTSKRKFGQLDTLNTAM